MENNLSVIQLSESRLEEMLRTSATIGAIEALRKVGVPIKEYYNRAELSKKFGRGKINRMISNNIISPSRLDGGTKKYLLSEVELKLNLS